MMVIMGASASVEKMEAWLREVKANPEETETIVEQLQVPKEEAVMEIIGIPEGQCGDQ
jgi:hypothetical protein